MKTHEIQIPGIPGKFSLSLPAELVLLRNKALALHAGPFEGGLCSLIFSDAEAWGRHTSDEDWLVWRARRCAERLRIMPIELEPGERIVGRPRFGQPTEAEKKALAEIQPILESIPPFPGGDTGHFNPDYQKLLKIGIRGLHKEIETLREGPDRTPEQCEFYNACDIALQGLSDYISRIADECVAMVEIDRQHEHAWRDLADSCRRMATDPPTTFHEAMQLLFMTLVALWFSEDHGMTNAGRIDQILRPFYEKDLRDGRISSRTAFELICALYIQLNRIYPAGLAQAVLVGGRDSDGRDVTNDLTYLCLAARQATQLVYPTVGIAWHKDTPTALTDFAVTMLASGVGDPAFFNDDLIAAGLRDHGVSNADSHNYMNSTCVEIKVVGASNIWVTAPYFNVPQALLDVINDVVQQKIQSPTSFAEFSECVRQRLSAVITNAAQDLDRVWQARKVTGGLPLASCFTADCLERGQDFDRGGARYGWVENSFVGLANFVDSMVAVNDLVYTRHEVTLAELGHILADNFEGREDLKRRIETLPQYGTDSDVADSLAREWTEFLMDATEANVIGDHRYVPGFFCWIMHGEMGKHTGATPDGRCAGLPLADGAGAAQGRERRGPTASVLSTTKWSHRQAIGGLVHNLKVSRNTLSDDEGRRAMRAIIETYLERGGFEIQVNAVSTAELLDAQEHPDQHRDLLVRVAGYSDYFVHLSKRMQDEVIARTEHERVG